MVRNLLLCVVALLLSLFFLEITLRIISPPVQIWVGETYSEKARLYGWAPKENMRTLFTNPDTGGKEYFRTNSHGWKDIEHTFQKPPGLVRILIIGDSYTYANVSFGYEYHRQLERQLHEEGYTNIEVIALGVGGWSSDQEMEVLINEGIHYSPDIVILQFCANDILELNWGPSRKLAACKPFFYDIVNDSLVRTEIRDKTGLVYYAKKYLNRTALVFNLKLAYMGLKFKLKSLKKNNSENYKGAWYQKGAEIQLDKDIISLLNECSNDSEMLKAWKMLEFMVIKMKNISLNNGAQFLIFSEAGDTLARDWRLKHHHILNEGKRDYAVLEGEEYQLDFYRPLHKLESLCRRCDIALIKPQRGYPRYEFDTHTTRQGNLNMALDIRDFLLENESLRMRLAPH